MPDRRRSMCVRDRPETDAPEASDADTHNHDDDDLIDDEIIEIFQEEVGEVLDALDEYFPRWAANTSDEESLVEFRRAFHTLKGSGRMVGASTVGELGWSVENMLNRVIDRTIVPTAVLIALVQEVRNRVPALVNAFTLRQPDPFDVQPLADAADTLAAGGQIDQGPVIVAEPTTAPPTPSTTPPQTLSLMSARTPRTPSSWKPMRTASPTAPWNSPSCRPLKTPTPHPASIPCPPRIWPPLMPPPVKIPSPPGTLTTPAMTCTCCGGDIDLTEIDESLTLDLPEQEPDYDDQAPTQRRPADADSLDDLQDLGDGAPGDGAPGGGQRHDL
ncbi:Hpt domain-containing protein, partial [Aestuariivita sp.]|uniref:Hpt domain-containing protein n=1 Tax=Aestuariivita sp. TaxID=1872407 RepID=UPI0025BA18FA